MYRVENYIIKYFLLMSYQNIKMLYPESVVEIKGWIPQHCMYLELRITRLKIEVDYDKGRNQLFFVILFFTFTYFHRVEIHSITEWMFSFTALSQILKIDSVDETLGLEAVSDEKLSLKSLHFSLLACDLPWWQASDNSGL